MNTISVISKSEDDTRHIAEVLSRFLKIGDMLLLSGELASGKTCFVKGLATAMASSDPVTSPTYTLVHTYNTDVCNLMHIDAYRLSGIEEFRDLGLDEYFDESITVIEWGEKTAPYFTEYLSIDIKIEDANSNLRILTMDGIGKHWEHMLPILQAPMKGLF